MITPRLQRAVARTVLAGLPFACAGCSGDDAPQPPFVALPLERALAQAGQDGKVVFVDFGASWCGPCKKLAKTTLADERVRAWLRDKTVPLRIDIDESRALAQEFKIESVPTMLFLRPDRSVLGSIIGYRDVDAFLGEAEQRLQGITALDESARAVQQEPGNASKHFGLFRELLRAGKNDEALQEAEVYWTTSRSDTAQAGVRGSFFLSDMKQFAAVHAPARERMEQWLRDARTALTDGGAALTAAMEFCALTRESGRSALVLEAADELLQQGAKGQAAMKMLATIGGNVFLEARRYAQLVDAGACEPETVRQRIEGMQMALKTGLAMAKEQRDEIEKMMRVNLVDDAARAFEALAGVGRTDDALAIAKLMLGGADDGDVRARLAKAAERATQPDLAKALRDRQ